MRKPNKKGCIPSEDVCLEHCQPLICRHGCEYALSHKCKDAEESLIALRKQKPEKDEEDILCQ